MSNVSEMKGLCIDYGNNIHFAQRLGREVGEMFYWNPTVSNGFPEHTPLDIGRNVPGITKVKEWSSVIYEVDFVAFADSMEPNLQQFIRSLGIPVFGSAFAERLEHDRKFLKETLKAIGLPVGIYYTAEGIDRLDEMLKEAKDVYVKSRLRGDMETWHHLDYRLSNREIKRMRHDLGLYEKEEVYVIEEPIDGIGEIGIDTFCIDGKYPKFCLAGIEIKDCGYCGRVVPYDMLPYNVKEVTDKLGPVFEQMGYRSHYSNEMIVAKDKRMFLLDNSNRIPSPPGALMMEVFKNYPQIVVDVANGIITELEFTEQWGVELIIKSDIAECGPSPLLVPDEFKNNVKIKNLSIDEEGTWFYIPNGLKMKEIGSVVATGITLEEAAKKAAHIAESIQGFDTYVKTDSIDKAQKSLAQLSKAGLSFI